MTGQAKIRTSAIYTRISASFDTNIEGIATYSSSSRAIDNRSALSYQIEKRGHLIFRRDIYISVYFSKSRDCTFQDGGYMKEYLLFIVIFSANM